MFDRNLIRQLSASRLWLALSVGLSLLSGGLIVAQAWWLSRIIDQVFLGGRTLAEVWGELTFLLLLMGLRAGASLGSEVTAGHVALRVKTDLRQALFNHLLALGPAYARAERTGELTVTVVEGIEALEAYFSQYLPQLVLAALIPLSIVLVVFPLDLLSAVVLVVTAPLIPLFMVLIGKAAEALTQRQYALLSRLSAHFLDILQGLTTLKLLGQSHTQAATIARFSEQYRIATLHVLRVAFLSALVLELVATLSTAIVAVEIGLRLLSARLDFPVALFILILAPEFYLPLRQLGARFHAAASGVAAAKRIFEILAQPAPTLRPPKRWAANFETIALTDVHFAYPGQRQALRGVSFEIHAGQTVALVGPSGAGKTTLLNLLLRFITPEQGDIRVDGVPLHAVPLAAWRAQMAYLPQHPHLFHDTLAANLRLARPDATDADLIRAAQQAHLHDFIATLPHGYQTMVGEQGARLSGGQAQRVALARAFLRDAPVLILDEPTSQVDPELEALLQDSTERLMRGRTVVVVAHRLSSVERADAVVVLAGGRVTAMSRPGQLSEPRESLRRWLWAEAEAA